MTVEERRELEDMQREYYAMEDKVDEQAQRIEELEAVLQRILWSGVEMDDLRIDYVVMQVDRGDIEEARAALATNRAQIDISADTAREYEQMIDEEDSDHE